MLFAMKSWMRSFVLLCAISQITLGQTLTLQTFSSGGSATAPLVNAVGQPIASSTTAGAGVQTLESGFAPAITAFSNNFPPSITYAAESAAIHSGDKLSVTVTDADGISKVTLFRRAIANATFDSVACTAIANNAFESTIQSLHFDDLGIEYYFKALDNTGKRTTKLDDNGKYFHRYKDAEGAAVPPTVFNIGDKSSEYKIITIPYALQIPAIGSQFNELGEQSAEVYRLATYAGNSKWNEYPSTALNVFERGKGYWFLTTKTDASLFLEGESTPQNFRGNLFQMTLQPEWNQIGNPYPVGINWNDVLDYNDNANIGSLKIFNSGYADANELKPYEGGFVRNSSSSPITISIPFKGQTTPGGRTKNNTFSTNLNEERWMLKLSLTSDHIKNSVNGIGMHPDASLQSDAFDDFYPPRFADYLEIKFDGAESSETNLAKNVVPRQDSFVWSFTIDSPAKIETQMEWDNTAMGSNKNDLLLVDESQMTIIDMRERSHYPVAKGIHYKIYYGENIRSEIKPLVASVAKPYPNPYHPNADFELKIPFGLPGEHHYQVTTEILDGQGKSIRTIWSKSLIGGFYQASWDGAGDHGERSSPGLYLVKITIAQGISRQHFFSRLLLK
jgi:hypothetical protein